MRFQTFLYNQEQRLQHAPASKDELLEQARDHRRDWILRKIIPDGFVPPRVFYWIENHNPYRDQVLIEEALAKAS